MTGVVAGVVSLAGVVLRRPLVAAAGTGIAGVYGWSVARRGGWV